MSLLLLAEPHLHVLIVTFNQNISQRNLEGGKFWTVQYFVPN